MDPPYLVSGSPPLEGTLEVGAKGALPVGVQNIQHQVDGGSSGTAAPLFPSLQRIPPKGPQLRGAGSDLEPMVTDEEEVIRSPFRPSQRRRGGD